MMTFQSVKCSTSQDSGSSSQCHDDTRISLINSNQMCGIRISNPEPDDMGIWKVHVSELRNGNLVNTMKVSIIIIVLGFLTIDYFRISPSSPSTRASRCCRPRGTRWRSGPSTT